jgi:hypothetical protein
MSIPKIRRKYREAMISFRTAKTVRSDFIAAQG